MDTALQGLFCLSPSLLWTLDLTILGPFLNPQTQFLLQGALCLQVTDPKDNLNLNFFVFILFAV